MNKLFVDDIDVKNFADPQVNQAIENLGGLLLPKNISHPYVNLGSLIGKKW